MKRIALTKEQRQKFQSGEYTKQHYRKVATLLPCSKCLQTGTNKVTKHDKLACHTTCVFCKNSMKWAYSILKKYSNNVENSRKLLIEYYSKPAKPAKAKPTQRYSITPHQQEGQKKPSREEIEQEKRIKANEAETQRLKEELRRIKGNR